MKLILAPMAAITHSGFRKLIADYAEPNEYFTEMIHAPSAISGGDFEKWYFRTEPSSDKLIWQITSPEADAAIKSIPLLLNYGGCGIDLNMGCCAPQIVRTGAGFAWMQKSFLDVAHFVSSIKKEVIKYQNSFEKKNQNKIRLSVKLRLGEKEDYSFLIKFCKMLICEGVDLITLHPRTQKEKLSRHCKYEYIGRLAEDLIIPIYGNGDINTLTKFEEISSKYKCSGWMIGRAIVQKPWFFYELQHRQTQKIDLLQCSLNFIKYLKTDQPPDFYLTRAQRFFNYFCNNFQFSHYLKSRVLNSKNIDQMHSCIEKYVKECPQEQYINIQ